MSEWAKSNLGSLISLEYGSSLPERLRSGQGMPVVGSSGIVGYHNVASTEGPGIVVGRKGTVGALTWLDGDFTSIDTTYWVRPIKQLDLRWLYLAMERLGLRRLDSSTGVPGLNRHDAYELSVEVPPLDEQRRIAEILVRLDDSIALSDRATRKLTHLRDSLLHELVGRRFQDRATRRQSLGSTLAAIIDFRGRTPRKLGMAWGGGDIPALSANNVQMGSIDFDRECYLGSEALYRRWMTSGDAHRGDVLVTMEAPLGNVAVVPDDRRYILSQRVVLLRFESALMLNAYAKWLMTCLPMQREMRRRSTGTTAVGIRRSELERIEVPVVSLEEQARATESLDAVEGLLQTQSSTSRKLRATRDALAADLLTGRVRTVSA